MRQTVASAFIWLGWGSAAEGPEFFSLGLSGGGSRQAAGAHEHDSHGHDPRECEDHEHDDHGHGGHDDHGHDDRDDHGHDDHDHDDHDHGGHDDHDHGGHDHDDHGHGGHDHDDHDHGGHDDHGHGGHDHAHDLRGASRRSLIIALALISSYMLAEVVGGILSGSLALIADAGHMLTDAAAILMALIAMWIAERAASVERTFGYQRTEVLAAMFNTIALWLIAGWIVFEAYHRTFGTEEPHVDGLPVLIVGTGGLLINIAAAWVLHRSSEHSMNVEGAFQHVLADLMGSVGVIISAILIMAYDWQIADPILSVLIALLILWSSRHLMLTVMNVLLEGAPRHIDVYKLCSDIEDLEGVTIIHDVHVWTITSGSEAFTAHIFVDPTYKDLPQLRSRVLDLCHASYGIDHVTIQIEQSVDGCQEDHHVDHLEHAVRPSAG